MKKVKVLRKTTLIDTDKQTTLWGLPRESGERRGRRGWGGHMVTEGDLTGGGEHTI